MVETFRKKIVPISPSNQQILQRFPQDVLLSFSDKQKYFIGKVLDEHFSRKHKMVLLWPLSVPFFPSRLYFVFLAGRDIRHLSRQVQHIAMFTILLLIILGLSFSVLLGLLVLYIAKSALGINLFDDVSLGLWHYLSG